MLSDHLGCWPLLPLLAAAPVPFLLLPIATAAFSLLRSRCTGLLEAALADYTSVLRQEPCNVDAAYQRGSVHHKLGKIEEAIADFSTVLQLDPNHVKAAYSRAACNNLAGRFDDANGALCSCRSAEHCRRALRGKGRKEGTLMAAC